MFKKILFSLFLWLFLAAASTGGYLWHWLHTPVAISENLRLFTVERGDNLYRVSNTFAREGILHWPKVWILFAKLNQQTAIDAGEYSLAAKESPVSLLALLRSGKTVQRYVTLIEGHNFFQILDSLHSAEGLKRELERPQNLQDFKIENIPVDYLEGWFFPETYAYSKGDSDLDILHRAYKKMRQELDIAWQGRAKGLPYANAYQALIMASIVEKETGAVAEREQIAGVFVRRLQKGMRLQTDPTVIYGMGADYQGNVRRRDLQKPTPYNTYTIHGLPPTPIAMPGKAAIHAAMHPAPGKSLYFVARGDGSHQFSQTLDEHNRAVAKYQLRRTENYRSSPAAN